MTRDDWNERDAYDDDIARWIEDHLPECPVTRYNGPLRADSLDLVPDYQ